MNDTERSYVSCRNASLTEVPVNLPNSTVSVDFGVNNIESLGKQRFKGYPNLVNLTLSNNRLSEIRDGAFEGLQKLECLSLQNNSIRYNDTGFHMGAFKPLVKLLSLNIQQNISEKDFKDENYDLSALSDLLFLENLYLDGIPDQTLGKVFQQLTSLKQLIFGKWGRCVLRTLSQDLFPKHTSITHLSILNCNIEKVEAGVFEPLTRLRYLDLSFNKNLTFDSLKNITYGLQSSNIETLKINRIHKQIGPCVVIREEHLKAVGQLKLRELYVESNRITSVEEDAIQWIPFTLETLSVRDNDFLIGKYMFSFLTHMMFSNLTCFIASDMFRTRHPTEILTHWKSANKSATAVKRKYPRHANQSTGRQIQAVYVPEQRRLHQHSKGDTNAEKKHNADDSNDVSRRNSCLSFPVTLPPKLSYIDASNIGERIILSSICLTKPNNLCVLNLRQNLFWKWEGPFSGLDNLTVLDLSWNFCSHMSMNALQDARNLLFLNISRNYLDISLRQDTYGTIFQDQGRLEILDLSDNRLTTLPKAIFKGLVSLKELYLTQNLLIDINVELAHIKSLGLIKLDWNQLETISESTRNIFDQLAQKHSLVLDLANNKFKCNCDNMAFLKWMTKSSVTFENIHEYLCYFDNGQTGNLSDVDFIYNKLEKKCTNFTALIITLTAAVVLSLTLISAGVVYRYRWNLRYIYYMAKYKANHKRHGYDAVATADEYVWDVNVSYADEDFEFVAQKIYTELEENRGVKLFIRDRNAPLGALICNGILDAIAGTKKTLVILSKAYLKHKWCVFEMNMVGIKALKTDSDLVCVLLLEDVPHNDLPLKILKVIKDQEFLEYPGPADLQNYFWDRLRDLCTT